LGCVHFLRATRASVGGAIPGVDTPGVKTHSAAAHLASIHIRRRHARRWQDTPDVDTHGDVGTRWQPPVCWALWARWATSTRLHTPGLSRPTPL